MADHDFTPGEELRVKAASYRRPGTVTFISRGQLMEVNEKDLKRSDAHLIWERPVEDGVDPLEGLAEGTILAEDQPVADFDYEQPEYDQLLSKLQGLNVTDAKKFLSRDEWTVDGLRLALDAEEAGKDRTTIAEFIGGRIEQVKADEEDEAAEADEAEDDESESEDEG